MLTCVRRALVLYNAAVAHASAGQNPVLVVGGQQMAAFIHSPQGLAVLALPGRDVVFVPGAITPKQVGSHRPSYINAILIQSRGNTVPGPCTACQGPRPGLRPFPECRRVPGHFGGCCGNCKWRDHAFKCSVRDDMVVEVSDDDDPGEGCGQPQIEAILKQKMAQFINLYEGQWVRIDGSRFIDIFMSGILLYFKLDNLVYDLMRKLILFRSFFYRPFNVTGSLGRTLLSMSVSKALLVVRMTSSIYRQSLLQLDSRSGFLLIKDTSSIFFGTLKEIRKIKGQKGFV